MSVIEACDAAADAGDEEAHFGMCLGKLNEIIDIRLDGIHSALHSRDGVALSLQPDTLAPDSTELLQSYTRSAAAVHSCEIAAEDV